MFKGKHERRANTGIRKFLDLQEKEIERQYRVEEISTYTLARKLNCSQGVICKIVNKWGKTRNNKEAAATESCKQLGKQNNFVIRGELCGENHPIFGRTGKRAPNYKNGKIKDGHGRILIFLEKKTHPFAYICSGSDRILEHRLVMENYLKEHDPNSEFLIEVKGFEGKFLDPTVVVYHINGIENDNRVENLRVFKNQSECTIFQLQTHLGLYKNTGPELKMKEILNELNIPFEHQFRIKNCLYDFHILNTNILIEVDGDYWHGNPKKFQKLNKHQKETKQKDFIKEKLAKTSNFILLRFWESDILKNTEEVKNKLGNLI